MKNIHVLPTDKPSRLVIDTIENKLNLQPILHEKTVNVLTQNIYITSDEEIREVDYSVLGEYILSYRKMHKKWGQPEGKKIILTTDQDLIKDGVQAIDDEFLEWFVKNPSCESVEIKKVATSKMLIERLGIKVHYMGYKIIIPKEEPKQDLEKEMFELEQELDIPSHLRWHNSKPKQETLEETAEIFYSEQSKAYEDATEPMFDNSRYLVSGFIDGAKWQKEQDKKFYSEEEVLELFFKFTSDFDMKRNIEITSKEQKQWLEQFKNK